MTAQHNSGTLTIDSLSVDLAAQRILHEISLEVPAGTTTAVVGLRVRERPLCCAASPVS